MFLEMTRIHYDNALSHVEGNQYTMLNIFKYFQIFSLQVIFFIYKFLWPFLNTLCFIGESYIPNLQVLDKLCLCLVYVEINRRHPDKIQVYIQSIMRENMR